MFASFKISDYETRTFLLLAFITIPAWGTVNEDKKETYPTEIQIMGKFEDHKDRSLVLPLEAYLDGLNLPLPF